MSTEKHQITVSGLVIDVVRKNIKNLHLGVYPPAGRVRVAAPLQVNDESVRLFTISRLAWIKRQQAKFENQERQSAREFVSGESHYYQGNRYLLNVIYQKGSPAVIIRNNKTMDLFVRTGSDTSERERALTTWYRRRLKEEIAPLIAKWEAEMIHLLERHHNDRFITYMNSFMPLWQYYREELNRAPLGHESWEY